MFRIIVKKPGYLPHGYPPETTTLDQARSLLRDELAMSAACDEDVSNTALHRALEAANVVQVDDVIMLAGLAHTVVRV